MRLSGGVFFEKNMSNEDSSFVTGNENKVEGGFSIYNAEIASNEVERGNVE